MKRRDPTRIELKLDDIHEYDQMKRDMEMHKKSSGENDPMDASFNGAAGESVANNSKSRTEIVHKRIGFDPTPKL